MLHPAMLGALALLVINDHVLKEAAAGTAAALVTGKLSDFAGLAFFPVLLWSAAELAARALGRSWVGRGSAGPSFRLLVGCALFTALFFSLTKTWSPAAELARAAFGAVQWPARAALALLQGDPLPPRALARYVVDPTDLLALPAVAVSLLVGRRRLDAAAAAARAR
jgi:hypothetical protein